MTIWTVMKRWNVVLVLLPVICGFCQGLSHECWGAGLSRVTVEATAPQQLGLTVGKSVILQSPDPVNRVSLVAPELADVMILTPRQIYLTGKAPGTTNLTLWVDDKVSTILDVEVSPDLGRLKETIHKILPEEKDIRITSTHDNLTVSGTVSSPTNLSQVLALAEPYFPKKVVNLLEVSGVHQVMLEVRVAEISRSLSKRLGVNLVYISNGNFGLSLLKNLTSLPSQGFPGNPLGVSDKISGILRWVNGGISWTAFIDALKEDGLLKVLAEPTLITLSGKTANFLAGGEFPVPVPQTGLTNTITVEYKPFGVGLNFTPTVLSSKKINMQVSPEVSELDFSNAISISGFAIPSISTRRVSTTIELADGQSFAIAGLLKDEIRESVAKFPVLGDIPVLGALFRSSSFQKNDTELMVIVTPHLVKPLDMAKQTLPTDQFIEPDDVDFYLLGNVEGREKPKSPASAPSSSNPKAMKLEGPFGHITPK